MRKWMWIWLLWIPLLAHAENLFEAGIHGGVAGWNMPNSYVRSQVGLQAGGHLYYSYLSPAVFGFRLGATLDNHRTGLGRLNYEDTYSTIDVENQQMDIAYTISSLQERYSIWSVGIPVQLALSYKRCTFLIGPKMVFPLACKWNQTVDHAALSVYYPDYDNRVEESYPLAASRDFSMTNTGRITLPKLQWWLAAEFSYAIPVNYWARTYRSYILVGAYADYCVSRYMPAKSQAESLIMLSDTRDGFPLQRILTPVMEANRQNQPLVLGCSLFDVGIKISYAIAPYDAHSDAKRACNCL